MSNYKIATPSSELMQNYRQADVLDPQQKFLAVQSRTGASLLLSIDGKGRFYATREVSGDVHNNHGWIRKELGAAQMPKGSTCKTFAAAQAIHGEQTAAIQLAMVVDDGTNDTLHLSLGNSDADLSWIDAPKWLACPFTGKDHAGNPLTPPSPFKIVGALIGEATDKEYVVVDVARDPGNPTSSVSRYYIDGGASGRPVWTLHDLAVDLESKGYTTCLGRREPTGKEEKRHPVDGLYTSGKAGGKPVILYTPLYNIYDPTAAPESLRLHLTNDDSLAPVAMAACRNPDNSSDLYACAGGGLYYFASNNQSMDSTAVKLFEHPLLATVRSLFASVTGGVVTVWGLDGDGKVFHTSCSASQLSSNQTATAGAWSYPVAIITGVDKVAPFVNRANGAKTFFVHTGVNELKKVVKSPGAKGAGGLWRTSNIHLPPSALNQPAHYFRSYTTHVQVTGADGLPRADKKVGITSANVTGVYINNLYYVVGPTPIHVDPDPTGSVTIIEAVSRLDATQFSLSIEGDGGPALAVDPMQTASTVIARLRTLNDPATLSNAQISYQNPARQKPRKLVQKGTHTDVVNAASNIDGLWKAHDHIHGREGSREASAAAGKDRDAQFKTFLGGQSFTLVDAGDLLSLLEARNAQAMAASARGELGAGETWWEVFVHWIEDAFKAAWHFIVKIGEAIYAFVVDTVELVFAAFKYVFNVIVEAIEDVIDFVKYLFDLEDMRRTKQVLQHVGGLFVEHQIDQIAAIRGTFDPLMDGVVADIDAWVKSPNHGIESFPPVTKPLNALGTPQAPSAAGSFLSHHFIHNVVNASSRSGRVLQDDPPPALAELAAILKEELKAIDDALLELHDLVVKAADTPAVDLLIGVIGILAKFLVKSLKAVIDALLTALEALVRAAWEIFMDPIYIPVVSDVLELFGVPEFSGSDVVTWLAAIPATIAYKALTQSAPFADDEFTAFLSHDAQTFDAVVARLQSGSRSTPVTAGDGGQSSSALTQSADDKAGEAVSCIYHGASSAMATVAVFTGIAEYCYGKTDGGALTLNPTAGSVIRGVGVLDNITRTAINMAIPHAPFTTPGASGASNAINVFTGLGKVLAFEPSATKLMAGLDLFCITAQAVMTGIHLADVHTHKSYGHQENVAICNDVSNISTFVARICRSILAFDLIKDPDSLMVIATIHTVGRGGQAGLQAAVVGMEVHDPHTSPVEAPARLELAG